MLRYLTLLLLTILFFSEATYSQNSNRIISIDEALSLTIQNNPTLKSSNTEIDISKALLRESKLNLSPSANEIILPQLNTIS